MGTCFTTTVPNRAELSATHLLGSHAPANHHEKQTQQHLQNNSSDSEAHDFQYQGFNVDHSITHNSNLHPVCPSSDSSPKHRPIKANGIIHGPHHCNNHYHANLVKLNGDLQQQIDILKQCSNDEIKMLKTRIQALEKQMYAAHNDMHIDDDYKENELYHTERQCTKGTQTKLCPNGYRIVKASQIYNEILQSHRQHSELEIRNRINMKQYDLSSLMDDYMHLLQVHGNNNNIFELKMVYLEINSILNSECNEDRDCKSITNIQQTSFQPNITYILDLIHCFLFHSYRNNSNDGESRQRLRDCIMNRNEKLFAYDPNTARNKITHLSINTSALNNTTKRIYSRTPPTLISTKSQKMIASIAGTVPINPFVMRVPLKERHNSVNSAISNLSRRSSSCSIHSKSSKSSISSLSQNNNDIKLIIAPLEPKPLKLTAIEMSEDRVRKLSGQMNEEQIQTLIDEYDNDQKIALENEGEDEELRESKADDDDDELGSSSLNEDERAEIELFKLEHNDQECEDKQRKGSKHMLMRIQQSNEWDVDTMDQTVKDMKKQLLHLALTTSTASIDTHQ